MTEQLELHAFNVNNRNDSDTEYHEIRSEDLLETHFSPEPPPTLPKAFDFFTCLDLSSQKGGRKKKKSKKRDSTILKDIIAAELTPVQAPVLKNVIIKVDYSNERKNIYLEKRSNFQSVFNRYKSSRGDVERGVKSRFDLKPVFTRVLENAISKENAIAVEYVEPALFTDIITEYQRNDVKQSTKFLDITIKDIRFSRHHDYSLEKLLCVKLIECHKEYCRIQTEIKDTLKYVDINKRTRDNLKQQLLNISSTKKEDLRFDQTVLKYTGKFLRLKNKYYQLLESEKESLHKVLSLWSDIEKIRHKSENVDTEYILEVTKSILDDEDFEKEFMRVFEIEYCDALDRIEYEYVSKYLEYKDLKQKYEAGDRERKAHQKPKLHIEQDKLKEEVEEIVSKIVAKEKINIDLKENKYIVKRLNKDQTPELSYNFKMYVDNVFVCESDSFTFSHKMDSIEFYDTLSIQILPNNVTLDVYLCEDDTKVASVRIHLPGMHINISNEHFRKEQFVYTNIVEPTARTIGSGFEIKEIAAMSKLRLKTSNLFKGKLYTIAEAYMKIGWNNFDINRRENIKDSVALGRDLKRLLHGIDKPNKSLLIDIIEKVYNRKIDDDKNLINALQDACKASIPVECTTTFIIDENSSEFVRLKLLHLRNSGGFDDVVNKRIPIFASQISTEQLNCLQKNEEQNFDLHYLEGSADIDPIDMQRFMSVKYVEKLNAKIQKNLADYLLKKTYKDVVRDFKDLSLRGLFSNKSNFDLETTSSIVKQQLLTECLTKVQEINITVMRACNLLDRSTAIISDEVEDHDSIAGFKVRPLRPFVKISYHDVSVQTFTAIGCHPTWNHSLKIKTKLSPLSSIRVDIYDECKVDVSEAYSDEGPSSLTRAVHYKIYNKWLGTVQIPLYTVLSLGSLQGTFKITTPLLLFGYDSSESKDSKSLVPEVNRLIKKETSFLSLKITTNLSHLGSFQGYTQPMPKSEDDIIVTHLNKFVTEYLNEFPTRNISLTFIDSSGCNKCVTEFLQSISLPKTECFPKNPKRIESAVSGRSSSSKSSRRKLSIATNGDEKEFDSARKNNWKGDGSKVDQISRLVDMIVRYVALIPTYEVVESHVVTLKGTDLLKVLYGSPLDHTILLASYFLHLGIGCWVVTGMGLPRDMSSYVLVKCDYRSRLVMLSDLQRRGGFLSRGDGKRFSWFVIDAVSGERFELRDNGCPLKTVNYVFNAENIWVNIQSSQDCENVAFDFSKSSDWQPVFEDPLLMTRQLPVSDGMLYSAPPGVESLREHLEGKLRSKVQKWRPHLKTVWNRYCSTLLREMLPHLEYWAFNPTEPRPTFGQKLKQFMVTYKMFGFPLNVPYINVKSVAAILKAAGVHLTDEPATEFALAVEVFAYPNNVLSVWVFLVSIAKI